MFYICQGSLLWEVIGPISLTAVYRQTFQCCLKAVSSYSAASLFINIDRNLLLGFAEDVVL